MSIAALKEGDRFTGICLIKKFEIKTAKNGKSYVDAVFGDKTGEISAKLWDVTMLANTAFASGNIVRVSGSVERYNCSLQMTVTAMTEETNPTQEELDALVETAPYPPAKMYEKIVTLLEQIENKDIRQLALSMFEEKKEALLYYPAAKSFHHAVKGGLLYHIYSMFRCALPLLDVYDFMNKDLVYAGIALHDLGKIEEMKSDGNGIVSEYTEEGKLLGHIITTICQIETKAKELQTDASAVLLLKHMILSHHYHPEFGSPKTPMFAEAELLHYLDILDSRMNQMKKTIDSVPPGAFAERVWALDGRTIYHHKLDLQEDNNESI